VVIVGVCKFEGVVGPPVFLCVFVVAVETGIPQASRTIGCVVNLSEGPGVMPSRGVVLLCC